MADARGLGPRARKGVGVRVPPSAPTWAAPPFTAQIWARTAAARRGDTLRGSADPAPEIGGAPGLVLLAARVADGVVARLLCARDPVASRAPPAHPQHRTQPRLLRGGACRSPRTAGRGGAVVRRPAGHLPGRHHGESRLPA